MEVQEKNQESNTTSPFTIMLGEGFNSVQSAVRALRCNRVTSEIVFQLGTYVSVSDDCEGAVSVDGVANFESGH